MGQEQKVKKAMEKAAGKKAAAEEKAAAEPKVEEPDVKGVATGSDVTAPTPEESLPQNAELRRRRPS